MKLTSLKLSEKEAKKEAKCEIAKPRYPYGTSLRLDKEALGKLGLKFSDFKVGAEVEVEAIGTVTSIRYSEGDTYDSNEVCIQFEKVGLETMADAVDKAISEASE